MKTLSTVAIIVAGLAISTSAFADFWIDSTKVTHIYPDREGFNITVERAHSSSTCDDGKRFRVLKSHANYEAMVSTLQAAFLSQKNIKFVVEGAATQQNCAPEIDRVRLYR